LSTHARKSALPGKSRSLTGILESRDWFRDGNKGWAVRLGLAYSCRLRRWIGGGTFCMLAMTSAAE
jgi:hypothetical protein